MLSHETEVEFRTTVGSELPDNRDYVSLRAPPSKSRPRRLAEAANDTMAKRRSIDRSRPSLRGFPSAPIVDEIVARGQYWAWPFLRFQRGATRRDRPWHALQITRGFTMTRDRDPVPMPPRSRNHVRSFVDPNFRAS